jgi:hypothetical protein
MIERMNDALKWCIANEKSLEFSIEFVRSESGCSFDESFIFCATNHNL